MYRLHNRENLRQQIIDADELAAGRRSDVHEVSVGFCDLVGFTRLGEGVPGRPTSARSPRGSPRSRPTSPSRPCGSSRRSATRSCSSRPSRRRCSTTALGLMEAAGRRGRGLPGRPRRRRARPGAAPLGRLLRRPGQPRRAARRARAPGVADHRRGRARARRRRRLRLVGGGRQAAQGHVGADAGLALPPRRSGCAVICSVARLRLAVSAGSAECRGTAPAALR